MLGGRSDAGNFMGIKKKILGTMLQDFETMLDGQTLSNIHTQDAETMFVGPSWVMFTGIILGQSLLDQYWPMFTPIT